MIGKFIKEFKSLGSCKEFKKRLGKTKNNFIKNVIKMGGIKFTFVKC